MAYYYSLRGWVECDTEEYEAVVNIVDEFRVEYNADEKFNLYLKGWCWSPVAINWLRYVFYGASVQQDGLDLLETTVRRMTSVAPDIDGQFEGVGEDGERRWFIRVSNGRVTKEAG